MMRQLFVLVIVAGAVLADNYWCPKAGEAFECFESSPTERFCLTNGRETAVICSKCRKKFDFCRNDFVKSKRAHTDCGAGWESTPCTHDNSHVPAVFPGKL
ncbi:schistosomin-like precursor [Aplysia californica]|uniref:Schistosomin-like n=1 Tax=Aplysia californica TaxID=6500 RepID=Q5PSJ4_APLCA|nr:schistosomin-like precursor [Aplysia californica]AAV84471.1 schistosomin-like precursor [Aplysia californica]